MLEGLMQNDYQLTLKHVLDRMRGPCADSEVVTLQRRRHRPAPPTARSPSASTACARRSSSSASRQGDRVATFMWNSQEHLELYMARRAWAPCCTCSTSGCSRSSSPTSSTTRRTRSIFVDDSLVPLLEKVAPTFETRRALRDRGRRRRRLAAERAPLRGPARRAGRTATTTRSSTSARPRASATRAARPATRRASCTRIARTCCTASGAGLADTTRHHGVRPRAAGRPDVPRERVGLPVRVRDGRRRPRDARDASSRPSRWRS